MSNQLPEVVIVGGGFSGTMVAAHLLKLNPNGVNVTIIEPRSAVGLGQAYSTDCPEHLLNVHAARMSAYPDEPSHFLEFARSVDPKIDQYTFAPRMLYGQYLSSILKSLPSKALRLVQDRAVDITKNGETLSIKTESGKLVNASYVVIATGNAEGESPISSKFEQLPSGVYLQNPWELSKSFPDQSSSVLIIGTGLTAIDKVIELLRHGHSGKIYAISRHGAVPFPHVEGPMPRQYPIDHHSEQVLSATVKVRKMAAELEDWRSAIDSCRSVSQAWWAQLSLTDQRRFLDHVQWLWGIRRHRMAAEIANKIEAAKERGQLKILAARTMAIEPDTSAAHVTIRLRSSSDTETLSIQKIINCAGVKIDIARTNNVLLKNLNERGLIAPHPLRCGIESAENYRVIARDGLISPRLFAIGPLLRPRLFETIAVPELRLQAKELAQTVIKLISARK